MSELVAEAENPVRLIDVNAFRLVVLPTHLAHSPDGFTDYNLSYRYFKRTWGRILSRLNKEEIFKCEILFSSHYMITLFHNDEVVGQIVSRLIHLDSEISYDTSYFRDFEGPPLDYLRENQCKTALSLEWNSIASKFSRRNSGLPFVELTMQFAIKLARSLGADACVGVPRRLTGVKDVGTDFGFIHMRDDLVKYSCPVHISVGLIQNLKPHADANIRSLIEHIWSRKKIIMNAIESNLNTKENFNEIKGAV